MRHCETVEAECRGIVVEIRENGYTTANDGKRPSTLELPEFHFELQAPVPVVAAAFLFYSFVFHQSFRVR